MAYFGDLRATGLQYGDYTASSRGLTTINRGNRTIRTVTRRRHADSQLLMLPNPHHQQCGGRRRDRRASRRGESSSAQQATLVWRAPAGPEGAGCGAHGRWQGQAAVLVGGGRARAGLEIDHSER